MNRSETPRVAAQRELIEELSLHVDDRELGEPWSFTDSSASGVNTVSIFSVKLVKRPVLKLDGLEILDCVWLSRTEALSHPITAYLRAYLLEQPKR